MASRGHGLAARLERGQPIWIPDEGESPWPLTWAGDFAIGLAGLVGQKEALGEAFHTTSDEALT
ncbi:MAG: hypothetical protein NZM03_09260 [Limisphaera sp.]|nr:hypothetical protein [Limisphaera sp.]